MHAIYTNLGEYPVPIASSKGPGFVTPLDPNDPYEVLGEEVTVLTVGDNPDFIEELREALGDIASLLVRLVTFWRKHETKDTGETRELVVRLRIHNRGPNDLRVILGNNTNDTVLVAGNTAEYTAPDYIEVRELGV